MSGTGDGAPSRLARRLGVGDAVVIGLGSMLGAGIFVALGPAAEAAGSGLLVGLAIAAAVAYCNATSSAELAALYPSSGGTYVYAGERLGPSWGFLAGWAFVAGKAASGAVLALTVGTHVAPSCSRPVAVAAIAALTAVNCTGVRRTAALTRALVALVLAALALVVVGTVFGGRASTAPLGDLGGGGARGVLQSAGLLFFAFAGYARIATLGEEVEDPARTIPKAIPRALALALALYALVAVSALAAVGPEALAGSEAPLATAVGAGRLDALVPAVRMGGAIAALGVLLSLIAGVSRTVFAMAADGALPGWLAAVHPTRRVPHRADLAVGCGAAVLVVVIDVRQAIGLSSSCVLAYYALANASAWTLPPAQRRWRRELAAAGVVGCATLACTLPARGALSGGVVLASGAALWALRRSRDGRR